MALPWFRLYTEFASDPKVQLLSFDDQRHYIVVLCLKGNGILDTDVPLEAYRERIIAKALGLDPVTAAEVKRRLSEAGLVHDNWHPTKWDSRQFGSDSSTDRVRKFREKRKGNVTETKSNAVDTDRDSDTDSDSDADSDTSNARAIDPRGTETEIHAFVMQCKAKFPKAAREDWISGEKGIRNLLLEGVAPDVLMAAIVRYAKHCKHTNRIVQNPGNWFKAADRPWLQAWEIPKNKAEQRLAGNVSVMDQFVNGGSA